MVDGQTDPPAAVELPIGGPTPSEERPAGIRKDRTAPQRRSDKFSQCVYFDRALHERAVAHVKANAENGRQPKTFSALFHEAIKEYLDAHSPPAPPASPPAGAVGDAYDPLDPTVAPPS